MKVLITGGLGYLGQALAKSLNAADHEVTIVDSLLYARRVSLPIAEQKPDAQQVLIGDVRDYQVMERACKGVDVVVHLAAIVGEAACAVDLDLSSSTNIDGVRTTLEAAKSNGADFYLASTCSVYGETGGSPMASEASIEALPPYASQKLAAELVVSQSEYTRAHVLRLASLFGISRRPRTDLVINNFAYRAKRGQEIWVHGAGDETRPFVAVNDAADMICSLVARHAWQDRRETNIGRNNQNYTISQIAQYFSSKYGADVIYGSAHRAGDSRTYRVSFDESNFPAQSSGMFEEISALIASEFNDEYHWHNAKALQSMLGRKHDHVLQ